MTSTEKDFIPAGENLNQSHPDIRHFAQMSPLLIVSRWKTEEGKLIAEKIKQTDFKRKEIEKIVGKLYDHIDLRGFNFSGQTLSSKDLTFCDFYRANFQNVNCSATDFSNSHFSEANIRGTNFEWCNMSSTLLDNANYNRSTNFNGVDLSNINFTLATLIRDLANSQQRIVHLKRRNPVLAKLLWITSDYGRSLFRWLMWCVGFVWLFAFTYQRFGFTTTMQNGISVKPDFLTNVYYSIVTFATVGYGDVLPTPGLGQTIVMIEIGFGYLMGGLLVAILTKKVIGN